MCSACADDQLDRRLRTFRDASEVAFAAVFGRDLDDPVQIAAYLDRIRALSAAAGDAP